MNNTNMYYLYTSSLNPKGILAEKLLDKKSVQYIELNLDGEGKNETKDRAILLLENFQEGRAVSLSLPFLTHVDSGVEKLVLLGFDAKEWDAFFAIGGQVAHAEGTKSSAGIAPTGALSLEQSVVTDRTHVPVVSPTIGDVQ